jgi:L-threonylcarbamoyladenylate synthase
MNTLLLNASDNADLALAASLLQQGQLVAVPTETVYGLAADATNPVAVSAIFTAKGRPANHPLIVHIADTAAMTQWAADISQDAYLLADAFWPGPLTILLHKAEQVSAVVTGGLPSIGLRVPSHPVLLQLLTQHQLAVAAPSANRYKKLSPTSVEQVMYGMNGRISAVLDGGLCQYGVESTIVDLTGGTPTIVRAGPITATQLSTVLGRPVLQPQHHNVAVPGNIEAHYQPEKPLLCFSRVALQQALKQLQHKVVLLHIDDIPPHADVHLLPMPAKATDYASSLYRSLYYADQYDVSAIWCELPPQGEAWLAVHDRLRRAAYSQC